MCLHHNITDNCNTLYIECDKLNGDKVLIFLFQPSKIDKIYTFDAVVLEL